MKIHTIGNICICIDIVHILELWSERLFFEEDVVETTWKFIPDYIVMSDRFCLHNWLFSKNPSGTRGQADPDGANKHFISTNLSRFASAKQESCPLKTCCYLGRPRSSRGQLAKGNIISISIGFCGTFVAKSIYQ